jgi:8-oxo-dGTP pyrophosphatase MutT (NUDIX family)
MSDLDALAAGFERALLPHRMQLLFDAARPPVAPRAALLGCDGSVIGSVDPGVGESMWQAGLPVRAARFSPPRPAVVTGLAAAGKGAPPFEVVDARLEAWQLVAFGPGEASTQALAQIALWLAEQGLGGRWRHEALAVHDANGRLHGQVERGVVRTLGITTTAVHLVGFLADGRQWVQQRALNKATDPGKWDTLMGGQCGAGESLDDSLRRETWEEAGLHITDLLRRRHAGRLTFRRPVEEGYLVEHIDLFEALVPESQTPRNQDGEVERFDTVTPADAAEQVAEGHFTLEAALMMARAVG